MNKKSSLSVLTVCILFCQASSVLAAQNWPTKPFDATYKVTGSQASYIMRMATDGKGHLRTESNVAGYSSVSIVDYTNMTQISLVEQGKMAMKTKIPPEGGYITDGESAKQQNAKALGTKVVAGHPCHGWSYTTPSGKSEVWTADDIGCFVKSVTDGLAGKTVTELQSFSKAVPGKESFQVPPGYKLTSVN